MISFQLGIKTIFDENNADINMLKSNEKLFVSDAIQKAFIIVDEDGTEAAASTGKHITILKYIIIGLEHFIRMTSNHSWVGNRQTFAFILK